MIVVIVAMAMVIVEVTAIATPTVTTTAVTASAIFVLLFPYVLHAFFLFLFHPSDSFRPFPRSVLPVKGLSMNSGCASAL